MTHEDLIQKRLAEARKRLEDAAGLTPQTAKPFLKPQESGFTANQREQTTILFGGLTVKHESLLQGALEGLGYKCAPLPVPDVRAFQLGKEYGNNGQCNPTYFTVGNLVQHLQNLEEAGESREDILNNYVFLTAGACGPCRFGMYEAEYRLALRNSGFDGFRVLLFQQSGGLDQAEIEAGLQMNLDFFMGILNAFNMGDLLNEVGYQIRPYETNTGETDEILEDVMKELFQVMKSKKPFELERKWANFLSRMPAMEGTVTYLGKFLDQIRGDHYISALEKARRRLDQVEVDRFRVKPLVKITGEFWAQTTEGDGNFNMFKFLERENAEVLVEPVATWIAYMIHGAQNEIRDRKGLKEGMVVPTWKNPVKRAKVEWNASGRIRKLSLARVLFKKEYNRLREALGGTTHELADQLEMERLAHPMYNSRAQGGEGHLEVAKNIYYNNHDLAHMVLSLKPFGCMPSTQSDGVQSAVVSQFPDMIYLPIETSGEGEINAHSRVQMALGEARMRARREFQKALEEVGYPLHQLKDYVEENPEMKKPMYKVPHTKGYIGVAANFAIHVADALRKQGVAPVGPVEEDAEAAAQAEELSGVAS